jgi:hypothetical protein
MSTKPPNIFISWSGPRSKHVASALRQWLPDVIDSARPWMSTSDIDKGTRGIEEISKALDTIEVGISCLTPENLTAPWLLFEAGALSKRIGNKSRLCTYLLGGLKNVDIPQPLGMFQHTVPEKSETRRMLDSINEAINPTEPVNLERRFEKWWPDLEDAIGKMPADEKQVSPHRDQREMIAEVLDIVRGLQGSHWNLPATQHNFDMLLRKYYSPPEPGTLVCSKCYSPALNVDGPNIKCVMCGTTNAAIRVYPAEPPVESEPT